MFSNYVCSVLPSTMFATSCVIICILPALKCFNSIFAFCPIWWIRARESLTKRQERWIEELKLMAFGDSVFSTNIRVTNEEVSCVAARRSIQTSTSHADFWKKRVNCTCVWIPWEIPVFNRRPTRDKEEQHWTGMDSPAPDTQAVWTGGKKEDGQKQWGSVGAGGMWRLKWVRPGSWFGKSEWCGHAGARRCGCCGWPWAKSAGWKRPSRINGGRVRWNQKGTLGEHLWRCGFLGLACIDEPSLTCCITRALGSFFL